MKFRFCGDGDCPDWVLAEIISTLSVLSCTKLETLAGLVAKKLLGQGFEEDAIKSLTDDLNDNGKSAVACIHFLLINATRHNVSESVFNKEIEQLGLPKGHAEAVCRVLAANIEDIRKKLMDNFLKINELMSVECIAMDSPHSNALAQLELHVNRELVNYLPQSTKHTVCIDKANLKILLEELKYAESTMDNLIIDSGDKV